MVSGGSGSLLGPSQVLGGLYDAQGRALLDGHLDVPTGETYIEGIVIDGKTHLYYGVLPSLARVPVLAATDRFDGRLTGPSLFLGTAVFLFAAVRLLGLARERIRGDRPVTRTESVVTGAWVFLAAAATPVLFLASRRYVYHEAELWGAALALLGFAQLLRWMDAPTRGRLAAFGAIAGAAILARPTVGAGPAVAMGVVTVDLIVARVRHRSPRWAPAAVAALPGRTVATAAATAVTPVVLHAWINWARFGSLLSVPFDRQILSQHDSFRRAALDANGGSLFGPQFVPTTLVRWIDPTAIRFRSTFPFVAFPGRPTVFGDATFDTLDSVASLPASSPLLVVLAVVGLVAIFGRGNRAELSRWRVPIVVAAASIVPTLAIAFVAHRYLADLLPLFVMAATVGVQIVLRRWESTRSEAARRPRRRGVQVLLGVLAVMSVWISVGLGLSYQATGPGQDGRVRAVYLQQLASRLVLVNGLPVKRGQRLPAEAPYETLFVVGSCRALYMRGYGRWLPLARSGDIQQVVALSGLSRRRVTRPAPLAGVTGAEADYDVALAVSRKGTWRLEIWQDHRRLTDVALMSKPTEVTITFDRYIERLEAEAGGQVARVAADLDGSSVRFGRRVGSAPIAGRAPFAIEARPVSTAECRRILGPSA